MFFENYGSETWLRKTFQYAQSQASCRKFPNGIENGCGRGSGQKVCMTKRKTTATDLKKISSDDGKPSTTLAIGYASLLTNIKTRVRAAQLRAAVTVNRELIRLYWDIGKVIVTAQQTTGYGKQVVERLAGDLHREFPGMAGLSSLNLWRMRAFYTAYRNRSVILSQAVTESPRQKLSQAVTESREILH